MSDDRPVVLTDSEIVDLLADYKVLRLVRCVMAHTLPDKVPHEMRWEYYDYTKYATEPLLTGWRPADNLRDAVSKLAPTLQYRPPHVK